MVKDLFGWCDSNFESCTLPEAFFVFLLLFVHLKKSLNNLTVLYFELFLNLNSLFIMYTRVYAYVFIHRFCWSSDWPPSEICLYSSSYFLIYVICAFYPLCFRFSENIIPFKKYLVYQHFSWIKNIFFLTF